MPAGPPPVTLFTVMLERSFLRLAAGLALLAGGTGAIAADGSRFLGRWDLTVRTPTETFPSWLEVAGQGGKTTIRLQGKVATVHPVKEFQLTGERLSFSTEEWLGKPTKVDWSFQVSDGKMSGTQKRPDGVVGVITGVPAPLLDRQPPKAWGSAEPLFNGKNLTGWESDGSAPNHWQAIDGALVNVKPGANLLTSRKFQDFKLHVELNCPDGGNSGVYLRGRYEMQVTYEPEDAFHGMGAIYGFLAPEKTVAPTPGKWETFDVTLVGRKVTIVRNGVVTMSDREIAGITGGALDSREDTPGPLYLQGDHTGGMRYRNVTISVPK